MEARIRLAALCAVAALVTACPLRNDFDRYELAEGPTGGTGTPAQNYFVKTCVPCHGESGAGDGVAAANLDPKPRNFNLGSWQAVVTDQEIRQVILEGGAAVGKSAVMPPHPELKSDPSLLNDVVLLVRSYYVVRAVGEIATTTAYTMVVKQVDSCSEGTPPAAGNTKIRVLVTIGASIEFMVSPSSIKVTDSLRNSYHLYQLPGCEPALPAGSLKPGETAEGWVSYELPVTATGLMLHYRPIIIGGAAPEELSFKLGW